MTTPSKHNIEYYKNEKREKTDELKTFFRKWSLKWMHQANKLTDQKLNFYMTDIFSKYELTWKKQNIFDVYWKNL